MASPQNSQHNLPSMETTESEGCGVMQLYNFLLRRKQKLMTAEDARGVADPPEASQSPKGVDHDDKFINRIEPVAMDIPPVLSRPSSTPGSPRHTPPQLSPIWDHRFLAADDEPRGGCATESEVSNPESPQLPSAECWKYQLLPTSDSSPTAIRAKLTRSIDDDSNHDDNFSSEDNDSGEDEDAQCQTNGPLHEICNTEMNKEES